MTNFKNTIKKAKRRIAAAHVIHVTGRALIITIVIAIAVVIMDKLMNLELPAFAYIAIIASGAVIGVITSLLRKFDTLSVAVRLDRKLGLRDRLGTAESIRAGDISNAEFGELITRDAERVAGKLDVKTATPIRFSNDWSVAGLLVVVLGASIAFVPPLDRTSKGQTPIETAIKQEQLQQQQQEIAETIEQAVLDVDDATLDDEVREDLEALKRLSQQLANDSDGASSDNLAEARNRSAAELGEIAQRLEDQSKQNEQTVESIAERFAGMEQAETPMSSEEFAEALRKGEFENAADLLDELKREAEQMSKTEREAVADHFRNMSEQLSEDSEYKDTDEEIDPLRDAMHDLGMDDQTTDKLLDNETTEDEIASELTEQGVDEDVAQDLAQDIKDAQRQEELDQQIDEQTRDIADALNNAADDIAQDEPQQNNSQEDEEQTKSNSEDNSPGQQQESQELTEDTSGDQAQSQQTESEQGQQSTEDKSQEQNQSAQDHEAQQGEEAVEKTVAKPEQDQTQDQDKQQEPGQQIIDPANPDNPSKEEISQKDEKENQNPPEGIEVPDANNQSPPKDQQTPEDNAQGKEDPNAENMPKNLGEALRELAKQKRNAEKGKQGSKRLREAAQKLADSLSDEEKRELAEKWMSEFNKPTDANDAQSKIGKGGKDTKGSASDRIMQSSQEKLAPEIENIDVTGDKPAEKSIFEWLSDQPITGDPQKTIQGKEVLRKAHSAAEHAVGESTVPKRYHDLIQRYFGKLDDTVEKASKQATDSKAKTKKTPAKTTTEDGS